jgi:hypothetical protein
MLVLLGPLHSEQPQISLQIPIFCSFFFFFFFFFGKGNNLVWAWQTRKSQGTEGDENPAIDWLSELTELAVPCWLRQLDKELGWMYGGRSMG